jgi:PLP dependent protein
VTTISTSPPSSASPSAHRVDVSGRLRVLRERIERAGGDPARVRVVAVTKGFGPEAVEAARRAGLADLGENYAAELVRKATVAESDPAPVGGGAGAVHWHFLGTIQRNKVAQLAPFVGLWQSVAREAEGARIARVVPGAAVLVQVDTTGLPGRNGCEPEVTAALVAQLRGHGLAVRGLMTVAAPGEAAARSAFATVRGLADELGLEERSMGMSDDLEAAVAAGSTMVRVGRALFGERPPRQAP